MFNRTFGLRDTWAKVSAGGSARAARRNRTVNQRSLALLQILVANSFNVRKVLRICDELGIAYQRETGTGYTPTSSPNFEIN